MSLWGSTTQSDKDVIEYLLTDGGEVSPSKAAEETGYTYRTIRKVVSRCESVIRHTYGKLEIESKHQRELLLSRIRAREQDFRVSIEDAVLTAAEAATGCTRSKWSKVRRKYNITVEADPDDCRKLVEVAYEPEDRYEAREVIRELKTAYLATHDDRGGAHGVHAVLQLADGTRMRYKNLEAKTIAPRKGSSRARQFRDAIESVTQEEWEAWKAGGSVT